MPRIRIRTPGEKRVVGTPNCSTLTVESVAIAQRASLQLPAEAKLTGGGTLLEHWVWEFAELDEHARIDLIAEPGDTFDPPAASRMRKPPKPAALSPKPNGAIAASRARARATGGIDA